jgi:chaperonin cofactor prefoldin
MVMESNRNNDDDIIALMGYLRILEEVLTRLKRQRKELKTKIKSLEGHEEVLNKYIKDLKELVVSFRGIEEM